MYGFSSTPNIALAASILLLAPGFAFVNSFLDSFKGYMMMGWGRWMEGSILTLATSVGVIFAIALLKFEVNMELILKLVIEGISFASFAPLGFGMVFNVPKYTLKYCALGGAIVYI